MTSSTKAVPFAGMMVGLVVFVTALVPVRLLTPTSVDMGFETKDLVSFDLPIPEGAYSDGIELARLGSALNERLTALPGVQSVGVAEPHSSTPLFVHVEGARGPVDETATRVRAWHQRVTAGVS